MSAVDNLAVYQVLYPEAPPQADLLGLWQPGRMEGSFSIGGEMPGVVWRANLPEDPVETARLLNTHAVTLRQTGLALEAAGPLLRRDLQRAAADSRSDGQVGFGNSLAIEPPGADLGRYDLVIGALYYDSRSVSFDLRDELSEAAETVSNFAASVHRLVDQFALVESILGGRPSARTRVDWLGDVHTWWAIGSPGPAIADHRRVLAQAIATRQAWLRLICSRHVTGIHCSSVRASLPASIKAAQAQNGMSLR